MPGSTPSRCSKNFHSSLVPMSERQQLKLVRQLENNGGLKDCTKEPDMQHARSKSCNGRGETPLHKAAIKGDAELILKLLNEGADPNISDFAGWTPLHEACNHGWYDVALLLIKAGATVNAQGLGNDTPLHDAAMNGHTQVVQLLVESGADVNYRNKSGKTPCEVAAPNLMSSLRLQKFHSGVYVDQSATLRLHQLKKKSDRKAVVKDTFYNYNRVKSSLNMDEKNNKEDVYEFKSSKEATPVRGASASPEVDKNSSEPKSEKSGDGYGTTDGDSACCVKRTLTDVVDNDEIEDESKRKKRKEGDMKTKEESGGSSKNMTSTGRTTTVRNSSGGSEKIGKAPNHTISKNSAPAAKAASTNAVAGSNLDRKSPGSPKGSALPPQNVTSANVAKTELEQEDKSLAEGEKIDQGPKVPPLKIVIPQQPANEPEQGNRNGKNGASRHQALPYVVSSNSNDGEKEGLRSRSVSPTDLFKADEKKDPAIGMLSAEDQKGSLNHQRVLRSAHRTGSNNNGDTRTADVVVSRTVNTSGQSAGVVTNVALANNSNANNGGPITSTDNPSPQSQNRSSPLPQIDSNLNTSSSVIASGDGSSVSQNSTNHRSNTAAQNKTNGGSSSSTASTYDDKSSEVNSESNQNLSQAVAPNPAPVELHPRKRKLKHNKEVKETPSPQVAAERCESATASLEVHPHEQPVKNCYQLFLDIRKQIERRRKGLFPVQPKPPQGFKDYLMNRCTYVLAGNASTRQIPTSPLPQNLSNPMKDLFSEQEKERHRLRLQHVIEKEKLVLSVEQEILRVHGRAARALANQSLPFSVCTILKDEEVYNLITPEQEEKDRNARSRYNGRLFLSWLQDVDDKWEKIKEAMLLRHHNEAESLHAVQKMDWEWKMKELGSCEFKSKPVILENHVPMVHVSDDFDLLPA